MLREKQRRNQDSSLLHAWLTATQYSSLSRKQLTGKLPGFWPSEELAVQLGAKTARNVKKQILVLGFRPAPVDVLKKGGRVLATRRLKTAHCTPGTTLE